MRITAAVGDGGVNNRTDVRTVQRLLNEHSLPPLTSLDVDGIAGSQTIAKIRHFQTAKVGLRSPDGRVDPSGPTYRRLLDVPPRPEPPRPPPERATPESRAADRTRRNEFVRPAVKEIALTTRLIDAIEPSFRGVRAVVISGYLNDSDLFWKVNYHWEYLLWMVEHSLTLQPELQYTRELRTIQGSLNGVRPDPDSGYRTSAVVGKPADRSTMEDFDRRYNAVRQGKVSFRRVYTAADLVSKSSRDQRTFQLAAAPVARPASSKHSTGYALDIQGDNQRIKAVCEQLGATLIFDEQSHVHVEFANGARNGG